jgi:hypothetical protein
LNGKDSIWWEDLRNVKGIHEKELSWKRFEEYFKKKYLSEKYFDGKTKEFYELKMGQLTIEEYINKFLELIRYVHIGTWVDLGFNSYNTPTNPNYWPFRQHLRSRCSLTRSSNRGLQDTGFYNQRK